MALATGLKLSIKKIKARIAAVVTTALAAWHTMTAGTEDGSTDRLSDSSGNGNTAALFTGRGLSFDGVNDVVTVGATGQTVKSVVFYAYPDSTTEAFMQLQSTGAVRVEISTGTLSATGFTTPTLYVDGAAGSTVAATSWQQIVVTSATGVSVFNLLIGQSNTTYLAGDLSNVKLFDIELSGAQIAELYANPEQAIPTGATAANLVGWWPLADGDGAGIALDGSGNNNHGTISGSTEIRALPSPVNQVALKGSTAAMWFDGTNDYLSMGNVLDVTNSDFSITGWFISEISNNGTIVSKKQNATATPGFSVILVSGRVKFYVSDGTTQLIAQNLAGFSINKLVHFAVTYNDSGNCIVYVDGAAGTPLDVTSLGSLTNTLNFIIGGLNTGTTIPHKGSIFKLANYSSVLSSSEITEIYNGGLSFDLTTDSGNYASSANLQGYWKNTGNTNADWVDLSGNGNDGTVNGSPTTIYIPEGTTAGSDILGATLKNTNTGKLILVADGYAQVADAAALDIITSITLEAWVKPFSIATEQTIIGKNLAYALKLTSGAKPAFAKYTSSSETETATTATTLTANTWYHIAATYDGANVKIYIDGALDTTTAVTGAIDTNSNDVLMGALTSSTEPFDGYIDSVKIYSSDLTAAQVLENYNAEKAAHSN